MEFVAFSRGLAGLTLLSAVVISLPAQGQSASVLANDPYASRKVFYEELWQSKVEEALKYVEGSVVCVNVELSPQLARTVASKAYGAEPIAEVLSTQIGEQSETRAKSNNDGESSTVSETSYRKNRISESETTTQFAGLIPESVCVTVSVPRSYYTQIAASRGQARDADRNEMLAAIEQEEAARIEETVDVLLPPKQAGPSRVRISSFDDQRVTSSAQVLPNPKLEPQSPKVITVVFGPKDTAGILRKEERPTSRLRVAAHVTEFLANGRRKIEAQWTTTDGDQKMHQTMSGVVRSNVVGKDDGVINGDEVAQLRIHTLVVPEVDSTHADP